ncbi:PIN domain-containing protein [Streptomyces griseofuscus]|uniref:PIN-like domain-containing protein n=1 Tax=Streptomyces griseofuscus TaxID=146922 RepID=UPI0033C1432A
MTSITPGSFTDGYEGYWSRSADFTDRLLAQASVVLDTNVLLGLYRMDSEARDEFFSVLDVLADRLWVPRQVVTEFHSNRISALDTHLKLLKEKADSVKSSVGNLRTSLRSFANVRSLTGERKEGYLRPLEEFLDGLIEETDAGLASFDLTVETLVNDDPVLRRLSKTLDGRVGDGPTPEQRAEAVAEALRRGAEKIPPGYKDVQEKGEGGFGDYLIWCEMLERATRTQGPILFISNDAKEDWMNRQCGKTIGPRPELVSEMREVAGVEYHQISSAALLARANVALKVNVSQRTIDQAEGQQNSQRKQEVSAPERRHLLHHSESIEASLAEAKNAMLQLREAIVARRQRIDMLETSIRQAAKEQHYGKSRPDDSFSEMVRDHAELSAQNEDDLKKESQLQKMVIQLEEDRYAVYAELVRLDSEYWENNQ